MYFYIWMNVIMERIQNRLILICICVCNCVFRCVCAHSEVYIHFNSCCSTCMSSKMHSWKFNLGIGIVIIKLCLSQNHVLIILLSHLTKHLHIFLKFENANLWCAKFLAYHYKTTEETNNEEVQKRSLNIHFLYLNFSYLIFFGMSNIIISLLYDQNEK